MMTRTQAEAILAAAREDEKAAAWQLAAARATYGILFEAVRDNRPRPMATNFDIRVEQRRQLEVERWREILAEEETAYQVAVATLKAATEGLASVIRYEAKNPMFSVVGVFDYDNDAAE